MVVAGYYIVRQGSTGYVDWNVVRDAIMYNYYDVFGRVRKGERDITHLSDKVSLSVTGFDPLSCTCLEHC